MEWNTLYLHFEKGRVGAGSEREAWIAACKKEWSDMNSNNAVKIIELDSFFVYFSSRIESQKT
jgi:hypothetical protein